MLVAARFDGVQRPNSVPSFAHLAMPVPYLLYDSKGKPGKVKAPYDERAAMEKVPHIEEGFRQVGRPAPNLGRLKTGHSFKE